MTKERSEELGVDQEGSTARTEAPASNPIPVCTCSVRVIGARTICPTHGLVESSRVVGLLFAISGQYEEYRARLCLGYESVEAAKAEADRRNALLPPARDAIRAAWDLPDDQFELTGKREKRILNKLRRETADTEIESHDLGDLQYSVTEARIVR